MSNQAIQLTNGGNNLYPVPCESGSNENGYYIKLADGTLVQWGYKDTTSTGASTNLKVYLPIKYSSLTSAMFVCNAKVDSTATSYVEYTGLSNTSSATLCDVYVHSVYANKSIRLYWLSIGKWR